MVLWKEIFLRHFPELVLAEVVGEFGQPPYPWYIAKWLPKPTTEPEPEPVPEPESESTIKIEWDDLTELIGFLHSVSEQPEACAASPAALIFPLAPLQQISSHSAPTMVN